MPMKRRDIVIGVVLLAVLAGALYIRNRNRTQEEMVVPETLSSIEDDKFTHEVLADLPEPESGSSYLGWLVRGDEGDENYSLISTGQMRIAKGGCVLDFKSNTDYSDHNKVIVTLDKTVDTKPEEYILEGSF